MYLYKQQIDFSTGQLVIRYYCWYILSFPSAGWSSSRPSVFLGQTQRLGYCGEHAAEELEQTNKTSCEKGAREGRQAQG